MNMQNSKRYLERRRRVLGEAAAALLMLPDALVVHPQQLPAEVDRRPVAAGLDQLSQSPRVLRHRVRRQHLPLHPRLRLAVVVRHQVPHRVGQVLPDGGGRGRQGGAVRVGGGARGGRRDAGQDLRCRLLRDPGVAPPV